MKPSFLKPALVALILLAWIAPVSTPHSSPAESAQPAVEAPPERVPVSVRVRQPVAELASERFRFRMGRDTYIIPCGSSVSFTQTSPQIRHLVVFVHGLFRQAVYHTNLMDALEFAGSPQDVAMITPQFMTNADVVGHQLGPEYPYWSVNGWQPGHLSRNDPEAPRSTRISSFDAMDALLAWATRAFPNLESIAVAGFSAGGQFVSRYAAGNQIHSMLAERGIDVVYVITAPSHYLYLCEHRPTQADPFDFVPLTSSQVGECAHGNRYPMGLENLNAYMARSGSPARIREQLGQRNVILLIGEEDDERALYGLASGCASNLQGAHRMERARAYHEYMKFLYGPEIHARHRMMIVPGAGHNSREVFISEVGTQAILANRRR
jgi:hypothetical protein